MKPEAKNEGMNETFNEHYIPSLRAGTHLAGTPPGQVNAPPQVGTPLPVQVHHPTPGRYHPWAGAPPAGTAPWSGTPPPPPAMHAGIWSTSRRYASYWNAFLFQIYLMSFGVQHKAIL